MPPTLETDRRRFKDRLLPRYILSLALAVAGTFGLIDLIQQEDVPLPKRPVAEVAQALGSVMGIFAGGGLAAWTVGGQINSRIERRRERSAPVRRFGNPGGGGGSGGPS